MRLSWLRAQFFEVPRTATYILLLLNCATYFLCLGYSGGALTIPPYLLFRNGAMYLHAIEAREYWRLVTYAFLHANLVHLAANMLCLVLWGGLLEKRIGSLYFLIVYIGAAVAGAIVSNVTHANHYLTVGASGGIAGLLGALFCLWILGKIQLSAGFFAWSIGYNVAVTLANPRIDWGAHFGGFVAGLVACALLDIVEKANARIFRCKFPEFVKLNSFAVIVCIAFYVFGGRRYDSFAQVWPTLASYALLCFAALKLLDVILSRTKGLAHVVFLLATTNAAAAWFLGRVLVDNQCAAGRLVSAICANSSIALMVMAASAVALTIAMCLDELRRGLADIGFIAATMHAERRRQQGL